MGYVIVNENDKEAYDALLKRNLLKLVLDHKAHCNVSECDIMLYLVGVVAERAGLGYTRLEKELFA